MPRRLAVPFVPLVLVALLVAAGCGGSSSPDDEPLEGPGGRADVDRPPVLDPAAQRVAKRQLRGRDGAVVALELSSGRILVLAEAGSIRAGRTLVPPGSTLKALFAGAALEEGLITTSTRLDGDGTVVPGTANAGGERFGPIGVGEALVRSSNTAFIDLTVRLGARGVERALRDAGWGRRASLELPSADLVAGEADVPWVLRDGAYRDPDRENRATVAHLAVLAAAIAGDGRLPRGRLAEGGALETAGRLWSARTSAALRGPLRRAVTDGTGTSMDDSDLAIGAKTGTMPRDDGRTQASVLAWAPADRPTHALAVSVIAEPGQTGGTAAGPIARAVLKALAS